MPLCRLCETAFPVKQEIDGKVRNLQNRKYCLKCSPFGSGNTKKLERQPTEKKKRKTRSGHYAKWQKQARKDRKEKLVNLAGGGCVICGYNRCHKAMEFHHKDEDLKGAKSFGIAPNGMLAKWDTLVEEIKKCVLLCSNCHREVHEGFHPGFVEQWTT